MVALNFETGSIGYGNYFHKKYFCSAFTYNPNNEPCSGLDLTKERLWIHATCGSMSLPYNWTDKLKIMGFASVNIADMSKQVAELTDQCITDACEIDSDSYCKVKYAVKRACFCGIPFRVGVDKRVAMINVACGPTPLPNDWTDKLQTIGFEHIPRDEWH
ncbi:hypothetical protein RRF57_012644 [Xylaria bambusicola]|uniref:Uncharacterized protein n=1 Tax=Xylaria bambusicola TaxID=326684 RepID=A0AAN7ZB30_9PEZI